MIATSVSRPCRSGGFKGGKERAQKLSLGSNSNFSGSSQEENSLTASGSGEALLRRVWWFKEICQPDRNVKFSANQAPL
jgi:hypothetical protein